MTDAAPPAHTDPLGVVDPIRVPGVVRTPMVRVADAYRRLPVLGKVFVLLAIVDFAVRALGLFGTSLLIDLAYPITIVTSLLAETLPVLLPALLLARRPDAATATPLVLRGAIVIALVELLVDPLSGLAFGMLEGSGFVLGMGVGIARTLLNAVSWLAIAVGLGAITSSRPGPALAGLSNLVLAALLASAATGLGLMLVLNQSDFGDPAWNTASSLSNAMFVVESAALAYLAWIVIRGTNDERRPVAARYLATGAFVVGGAIAAIGAVVSAVALVQVVFALSRGVLGGEVAWAWLASWPTVAAVLVALALGLADNSVRVPGGSGGSAATSDPQPDPVRWPTPGGEVPTYRPVAPPPNEARSKPAKQPRRRRPKGS